MVCQAISQGSSPCIDAKYPAPIGLSQSVGYFFGPGRYQTVTLYVLTILFPSM